MAVTDIGYVGETFCAGCVAIPPEHRELGDTLGWMDIGLIHNVRPYAYADGRYKPVDQYQYNDGDTVGVELVFENPQPGSDPARWVINPDLYLALGLVKEGTNWVRPEEDFVIVIRETYAADGSPNLIEIRREFLLDYLAARGLGLRVAIYRQRIENVASVAGSPYAGLQPHSETRDGGKFELLMREINEIWGGSWAVFRAWRTDVDDQDDAPVMGPESDDNTDFESSTGVKGGYEGVRVEGEYWREEWIDHSELSTRVRGDVEPVTLEFIVDTAGSRKSTSELNREDIGRWLWFSPRVMVDLLSRRGFALRWYTRDTGGLRSATGDSVHFGINSMDCINVYAEDVARLPLWQQRVWLAHNIAPEGGVSNELLLAQVRTDPASTRAPEVKLSDIIPALGDLFQDKFGVALYSHPINKADILSRICRFSVFDEASLLRLAKELTRLFSDRVSIQNLRSISKHDDKNNLRSNKLLESVVAEKVGSEKAHDIFGIVAGVYDMRVGDAHPTSSSIEDAMKLARIKRDSSYLRQAEQLVDNYGYAIWQIGRCLLDEATGP